VTYTYIYKKNVIEKLVCQRQRLFTFSPLPTPLSLFNPHSLPYQAGFIIAVFQEAAACGHCGQQHTKHSLAKELLFFAC